MHKYLRSIGFSRIRKRELDALLFDTRRNPDHHMTALDTDGNEFVELRREIAPDMGLAMRGVYNDDGHFDMDYYFPYRLGREVSTKMPIEVVRASDRESYLGLCDDLRLGVDLIFFVQDMLMILESEQRGQKVVDFGGVVLSALSAEGRIVLPIYSTKKQMERVQRRQNEREALLMAARDGDHDAYEELSIDDMDMYAMISKRVETEDVLSIVNSYFMPKGIESDKYSILGEIIEQKVVVNHHTAETLYVLKLNCNNIIFDVTINEADLLGEPMVGRRFKGDVWMQGRVKAY
ncbi:MAG: DUF3881 family protein [Lachnospiraceae bacterium]|nr:DUF3881 family protein [Lachnospiraceae bacterium]